MTDLVIASNNKGKIKEIKEMIHTIHLLSLNDIGFNEEIPEPYPTFAENAFIKANTVHHFCGKNVFADDSGICVNALNGEPGVISAHYSGERNDEKNLQKILNNLRDKTDNTAYYFAVICLIWNNETYYFEGTCTGIIIPNKRGTNGFGYDPIFIPDGYNQTFAELPLTVKNTISHRGIAVKKMIDFLKDKV